MPSSCSYSLGEVRVLRKKRDLIEGNAMDRDSSVTVLLTRSMLTSLNDSTVVSMSRRREKEAVLTFSHFSCSHCWKVPDVFKTSHGFFTAMTL